MLKCDSLILTKYARNDSFIQKKQWKCFFFPVSVLFKKKQWKCFLCSLKALRRTLLKDGAVFFSKNEFLLCSNVKLKMRQSTLEMTVFFRKKQWKWFFCSLNSLQRTISKDGAFNVLARTILFYAQMWHSNCDKVRTKWQFY